MIEIEKKLFITSKRSFPGMNWKIYARKIYHLYVNFYIYLDVFKIDSCFIQQFTENEISIPKYVDNLRFRF